MFTFTSKFFCCELCDQYLDRKLAQGTEDGYIICNDCAESDHVIRRYVGDECFLYMG